MGILQYFQKLEKWTPPKVHLHASSLESIILIFLIFLLKLQSKQPALHYWHVSHAYFISAVFLSIQGRWPAIPQISSYRQSCLSLMSSTAMIEWGYNVVVHFWLYTHQADPCVHQAQVFSLPKNLMLRGRQGISTLPPLNRASLIGRKGQRWHRGGWLRDLSHLLTQLPCPLALLRTDPTRVTSVLLEFCRGPHGYDLVGLIEHIW